MKALLALLTIYCSVSGFIMAAQHRLVETCFYLLAAVVLGCLVIAIEGYQGPGRTRPY